MCVCVYTYGNGTSRRLSPRRCSAPSARAPPWPLSVCLGFTLIMNRHLYMCIYVYVWMAGRR